MRPFYLLTVSAAALSLGAGVLARRRSKAAAAGRGPPPDPAAPFDPHARLITRRTLQYFVVPMWTAAGLADWWRHRRTDIGETTGLKESIIHLLMLAEAAGPILAALVLELDPLILGGMIACFFLHEATAMWDVSYAVERREVSPLEQHVHSFLELTPLMAVLLNALLHWPQLEALAGRRVEPLAPIFRRKREPLPKAYVAAALGGTLVLELAPYLEEALRAARGRRTPADAPAPVAA
jgi:hypothetical protein